MYCTYDAPIVINCSFIRCSNKTLIIKDESLFAAYPGGETVEDDRDSHNFLEADVVEDDHKSDNFLETDVVVEDDQNSDNFPNVDAADPCRCCRCSFVRRCNLQPRSIDKHPLRVILEKMDSSFFYFYR
ncbi:hypothetical protein V6N13_121875 [Hibiscus sabdariffa]